MKAGAVTPDQKDSARKVVEMVDAAYYPTADPGRLQGCSSPCSR